MPTLLLQTDDYADSDGATIAPPSSQAPDEGDGLEYGTLLITTNNDNDDLHLDVSISKQTDKPGQRV